MTFGLDLGTCLAHTRCMSLAPTRSSRPSLARPAPAPTLDAELVLRLDRPGPRYTSYPTADRFTTSFGEAEYRAALARTDAVAIGTGARVSDRPISVYVHMPHCARICGYCACNIIGTHSAKKRVAYVDLVLSELARVAPLVPARRTLGQFHFGGGTPNSYDLADLERLLGAVTDRFTPIPTAELAIEVDPRYATPAQVRALRAMGLNRISFGVQDVDPVVQRAIGRHQSAMMTREAIAMARAAGFPSLNIDLVYGLPQQTPESFERTLDLVAEERPDRIALFSFAYLPAAKKNQRGIDADTLPGATTKIGFLLAARERLMAVGYVPIGMDHFALPGDALARARSEGTLRRNFQGYTVAPAGLGGERLETLGFGLSAISDLGAAYVQTTKDIATYEATLSRGELPVERGIALTPEDVARRALIEAIMTRSCANPSELAIATDADRERLAPLVAEGLAHLGPEGLSLTGLGELFPRLVAMAFDAHLAASPETLSRFSRVV